MHNAHIYVCEQEVQELYTGRTSSQKSKTTIAAPHQSTGKTLSGVIEGSKRGTVCTLYRRSPGCALYSQQLALDTVPPGHHLTFHRRTFRLISGRNKKIWEEEKNSFRCGLSGCNESETGPNVGKGVKVGLFLTQDTAGVIVREKERSDASKWLGFARSER